MSNAKFATAIHIMVLLAKLPEKWMTSDFIAGSIGLNPVIIRKALGSLRKAGLIISRQGKDGGVKLAKAAGEILLAEIYTSLHQEALLGKKNCPNPECPVGIQVNKQLEQLYEDADRWMLQYLGKINLEEFCKKFQ